MSIPYRFLPWARRGLARSHQLPDHLNANLLARPKVSVGLTLQAKQDGNNASAVAGHIDLRLYGPGDVIGIDPRLVVRTDPKPNMTNFEPNYLALVDFDPPDFPWMLTPAHANTQHRLRPWLVLVVLERDQVARPTLKPGRPLPSIRLTADQVSTELPDLMESWLWAHAQAVSEQNDANALAGELQQLPERNISRLLCPRRLRPRINYLACVVPSFEVGRLRGLGQPVAADAPLSPAWNHTQPADVELPIYYHWEFSTAPVGDIETLARRLKTPSTYKNDQALVAQLTHIGELPVAVDGDHLLFEGTTPGQTVFEGALVGLGFKPAASTSTFTTRLEAMLNSGQARASDGAALEQPDKIPTLSPPLYGEYPAKRHLVDHSQVSQHWLEQLNLQPRYRLAAGWGAEVVRTYQNELMQAAWEQVGEVLAAERAFSLSRLSRDVLKCLEKRHLARLPENRLLAVLAPARARVKVALEESLYGRIGTATLPEELFDGAMRRLTSAQRPTLKMAQWRQRQLALNSISSQWGALVNAFANATQHLTVVDPNHFVPDGILSSFSFDNILLPDDPQTVVDLFPYTGLPGSLSAGELRQIQATARATRAQAAVAKRTLPKMGDVWHEGILTETHQLRLLALQRAAGRRLNETELERLVKQTSRRDVEGVLLSVREGSQVSAQAMKIDGRNGNLKMVGQAVMNVETRSRRTASLASGSVAVVPTHALRLYGNNAVFGSLPPGVLGQSAASVSIRLDSPGHFVPVDGMALGQIMPTITLPPAIKKRVVVGRYAQAFKDYQQRWRTPTDLAKVVIRPVNFALSQSVSQVRQRIDPAQTVPARLASMLDLGEQPVTWDKVQGLLHAFISPRLDVALSERLRYIIPPTFDRVMAYPHLSLAVSRKLERLAPDVFLPGVGVLPDDFIMAVKTNPRFVEAFMVGVNHEMGRELLWQGYPTDQRGTPLQHFWQRLDDKTDIAPLHQWLARPLGQQPSSATMLVLLIRGQLLERFPNLSIYAYPKGANDTRPGQSDPPVAPATIGEMQPAKIKLPVLRGHLGKDITYVGFEIPPQGVNQTVEENIQNWFFILEEHMTEPRFGFDEPDGAGQNGNTWQDVDWSEVAVQSGHYFGSTNLHQAPPAQGIAAWNTPHAATVAQALLQRPFRGYYAGVKLTPPTN